MDYIMNNQKKNCNQLASQRQLTAVQNDCSLLSDHTKRDINRGTPHQNCKTDKAYWI